MSKVDVEQPLRRRLRVADLHPHLMCVLCGGYYVDATTIIECLHSFCKSCLVRYLESNKYCPICEVQVHKTKPLLNIRPDETLQNMVYKLVPGLFFREMKFRREFYAQHPEANPDVSPDHKGLIDPIECEFYSPEELVSLALEFKSNCSTSNQSAHTRYLRCPAAVTVGHLQKLVRNKFDLSPSQQVEVMFEDNLLTPDLSIMDVAYTFQRKRKEQFHLTYRILERESKKRKLDELISDENSPEKMDVDPPALPSANASQPSKPSGPSPPETKSKLDSIISRLGIAKQTESLTKKDKAAEEWKEVQLQISESGVMSVTDISSINKLINTIEKNVGPLVSKDISLSAKNTVKTEKGPPPEIKSKHESNGAVSLSSAASKEVKSGSKSVKEEGLEKLPSKNFSEKAAEIKEVKSEVKSEVKKEVKKETKHNAHESRSMPSLNALSSTCSVLTSACTVQQNIPTQTSTASFESTCSTSSCSQSNAVQTSCVASESLKGPLESGGVDQSNLSIASYSVSSSGSNIAQLSLAVNKSSTAALTTTTAARAAPLPAPKPSVASAKKSSSSPVGYKTLKCGPKNWNPTISRSSFLSSKVEQPLQQGSNTDPASSPASSGKSLTPPRFFKMRNTPRYLGNPASGVKAMYQVPESKPENPPSTKSPSVMKLDPRTLTPIVSNASSPASKSSPVQPKGRPPFPSTTLSAQVSSNHLPSSRSIATTTTSSPTTKHTDLASLRNSTSQPIVNPYLSFLSKGMPNFLFGMGPGLLPSGAQLTSMLRPGFSYPPITASGFHPALPQPAGMLFNHHSHQVHRQLNSSSPSSPSGYPSSLPSSPSMSLSPSSSTSSSSSSSSSKHYASSSKNPVGSDKASSNSSNQSPSKCKPQLNTLSVLSSDIGKVNGLESVKNMSPKLEKSPVANQEHRSEAKSKGFSVLPSEETKVSSSKTSNNNNTLSLSKSKPQSSHTEGGKLPLDVSNLVSKDSGKCSNDQSATKPKTPSSSMVQTQQS